MVKDRVVTGKDGLAEISDLEPGSYVVKEIEAPAGYLLDDTKHQVKVEDFQVTLVELKNHEESSLIIHKIDAQSKFSLAGAIKGHMGFSCPMWPCFPFIDSKPL